MIREVPTREWGSFLEHFGREHRAWLATVHVVDAQGTVTRSAPIALNSVTASTDAVKLEFLNEEPSVCVNSPRTLRIQEADLGLVQALEIETSHGQFMRLAFRATARPEELDGLAAGELTPDGMSVERSLRRT
jgi:hypothetical protein